MRAPILLAVAGLASASISVSAHAGSLRVCASDLTNFDDTPALVLPAGLVFTAWGPASGDLRRMRLDPNYPPARMTGQNAVVLAAQVTLTAETPCAAVPARSLVSDRHRWRGATLGVGDGIVFQAIDTLDPAGTDLRDRSAEIHSLYDLLAMNILTASVVDEIADPVTIP